jgi:hypothetical protein
LSEKDRRSLRRASKVVSVTMVSACMAAPDR